MLTRMRLLKEMTSRDVVRVKQHEQPDSALPNHLGAVQKAANPPLTFDPIKLIWGENSCLLTCRHAATLEIIWRCVIFALDWSPPSPEATITDIHQLNI